MKLSILSRYLLREIGLSWIGVTVVLVTVLLTSRLVRFLAAAASGQLPAELIFTLLGLKALSHLSLVLPASFFLAVVLAFGRLYRDTEMAALFACGVGPRQLYRALYLMAVPLALLVGWLSVSVGPWAARTGEEVQAVAEQSVQLQGIRAGRFITSDRARGMFYAGGVSADQRAMENVFVQADRDDGLLLVTAARARQTVDPDTGDRFLVLEDGYRYEGEPGSAQWRVVRFQEHGIRIAEPPLRAPQARREGKSLYALWRDRTADDWSEIQRRLSMPLMTLVLALLVLPLSKTDPRDGRYGKLLVAVLVFVAYSNSLTAAEEALRDGRIPVALGVWWVHALAAAAGLVWLWRRFGTPWRGGAA